MTEDPRYPSPEEENEFYAALGRAITGWTKLEDQLFGITSSILATTKERAAVVFYRTPTLDSRLTSTNDLVESFFPKHEPGEKLDKSVVRWKEIFGEIKAQLPTRNSLAHHPAGPIVNLYESEDGSAHKIEIVQASYRGEGERLRKRGQTPALGTMEIRGHAQIVSRLTSEIENFRRIHFPKLLTSPIE